LNRPGVGWLFSEFTLYRLEDGKFAEVWDHTDMDAVMRQIAQGEAT
jgi:predicted ester cyclase